MTTHRRPTAEDLRVLLSSRVIEVDLPLNMETRLHAAATRMIRDDRRAGVPEADRIDAARDFEHVLMAMADLGLEQSERDAGLVADVCTGRLRPALVPLHVGVPVDFDDVYPREGTSSNVAPRAERPRRTPVDWWSVGYALLIALGAVAVFLALLALVLV